MVKLLACDVDGTLMPKGGNAIPEEVLSLLGKLQQKGVTLAIASGRSYSDLKKLFLSLPKEPYYICNDGACTVYQSKHLQHFPISLQNVSQFLLQSSTKCDELALYSTEVCGIIGKNTEFTKNENIKLVTSLYDMKDPVYKIGIYATSKTLQKSIAVPSCLRLCSYSDGCIEYVSSLAEKGTALSNLQMHLFLTKYDTAAIGNYFNDVRMLKNAKYSAAIPTSPDEVKRAAQTDCTAVEFFENILQNYT